MNTYADVHLSGDLDHVTDAQLAAIDLLASLFTGGPGWRLTLEVDPGTVIIATPPRETGTPNGTTPPPVRPSEAPYAPEDGEDG